MAQNAVALNGTNAESRAQFSKFVVPILLYRRAGGPKPTLAISGIVTVSAQGFCHVIANNGLLLPKNRDEFRYDVVFPNGTRADLDTLDVEISGELAAFYCSIEPGVVDAVQFGNYTTRNQKLKMYLYEINASGQLVNDVTDGFVTHVGKDYIKHDCTPSAVARHGSPVFNEQRQLVGISFADAGVTRAFDVNYITSSLASFYEAMENKPLSEIIEHIKVVGEAKLAQQML